MKYYIETIKNYCIKKHIYAYMVGGAVRDKLMKKDAHDIDIAVSCECHKIAVDMADIFKGTYVNMHRDVGRVIVGKRIFDFCNFKGNDIYDDLKRRDFTINAIAIDLINNEIIDINNGVEDINNRVLRVCYKEAFDDDPLRMLRAVRLSSEKGFEIHSETEDLIKSKHSLLVKSAPERILDEVFKIFSCYSTHTYIDVLDRLDLLNVIFPVMARMKDIGKCTYHRVDAYTHSYLTLEFIEDNMENVYLSKHGEKIKKHLNEYLGAHRRFTIMKLGAFLHDIGKPAAMKTEGSKVSFRGHDKTGEVEFLKIASKYNMGSRYKKIIRDIILGHMRVLVLFKQGLTDRAAYFFFREYDENSIDVLITSLFDVIATTSLLEDNSQSADYWDFVMNMIDIYYTSMEKDLKPLTGREVMAITGAKGKEVGEILNAIEEEAFIGNIKNKQDAIDYLMEN